MSRINRQRTVVVLLAAALVITALALHAGLAEAVELAEGYCMRPSSSALAVGSTVPFNERYFAGGGEAISPFYRLNVDGKFWEPIPGELSWPLVGHATTLTLQTTNDLVVATDSGTMTSYRPSASQITCVFGVQRTPASTQAWLAEAGTGVLFLTAAWFVLGKMPW